jgi:hypothetical protein
VGVSSNLSLARNISAVVSGTNANISNAVYGRIFGTLDSASHPVVTGNYGLLLSTFGETSQDAVNQGVDVPGDAISVSFFENYMPDWDLADTWLMSDGMSYPVFK